MHNQSIILTTEEMEEELKLMKQPEAKRKKMDKTDTGRKQRSPTPESTPPGSSISIQDSSSDDIMETDDDTIESHVHFNARKYN